MLIIFGDHLMVTFSTPLAKPKIEPTYMKGWRKYKNNYLNLLLAPKNREICEDNVQNCWNDFDNIHIKIVDKLAQMKEFSNNSVKHKPALRYMSPVSPIFHIITFTSR